MASEPDARRVDSVRVLPVNVNLARIGDVTRDVGTPRFGRSLFGLLDDFFGIRFCVVFAFVPASEPHVIVAEGATSGDCELARKQALGYAKDCCRRDPDLAGRNLSRAPTVYQIKSSDLASAVDRDRSFEAPRIGHQLIQVSAFDGVLYWVSLCRDERAACFRAKDVAALRMLGRFSIPALHRHVELNEEDIRSLRNAREPTLGPVTPLDTPAVREHIRRAFQEAPHCLSPREAEVCAGIVLGYSTTAIGLKMQIAFNTVATHRKRAYRKLGVCTEYELFARYLETINSMKVTRRALMPRPLIGPDSSAGAP
jgi:DNA-binding CsgD family transcriptional regulator